MKKEIFYSACALNCPDICGYVVHVEDGKIIRLEGDSSHPYTLGRACPKGYAHVLRTYSRDRLRHPMRKQSDGTFKKTTWEAVFDEIAYRMREAREKYGPQSVGIYSGSGNDGMAPRIASRFSNVFGCRMIPGIVEICFEGAYEGARFNVGPFPPHELSDLANSQCIVIWGTNKFESGLHSKQIIQEALEKGAKLVVIDPRKTPHAKMADIYTTIRPGTDAALALGMANIIIQKGLHDKEFVENYVHGFDEYCKRVKEYDKQRVSDITWVDPNVIERIAITFATHGPSLIMTAPAGMNHYTNGSHTARAVHSLLAICGYLGVSGGGFQYLSSDFSPFNSAGVTLSDILPDLVQPVVPSGTYVPEYVLSYDESPLKVFVIQAANPMTQWPNTSKTKAAFDKIPFKVCIDLEMTDTARECDIVLPATLIFEHHNLVHSELHRIVQYAPKIIDPIGEAKHELDIWRGIAERLELGEYFNLTELDTIRIALESEECSDFTLEDLMDHPEGLRTKEIAIPFADKKFGTETGKVELYSPQLERMGFDPLPFHEEPAESPISTPFIYRKFPLIMITGRLRERLHSQYTTVEVGGEVSSFQNCTSCQKCVQKCPDEAISMVAPSLEKIRTGSGEETHAPLRKRLSILIESLAVDMSTRPLSIPSEITTLLIPEWDSSKCIGCRECQLDVCPFDVVLDPIRMPSKQKEVKRAWIMMHPDTAYLHGLEEGDLVNVYSIRGEVENVELHVSEDIDPRIIWSSDGWWKQNGNMNQLTDDKHTAFGHTPGFNSVLVRVEKAS
ncbi:MAG: molybdopterin-dependent oxidoreductase [Candidatus Lokiarchaeota archaeon]|nr:molybdopterin-dependent oxidoreductase [Candidatus Lokiarchaeota archaeon]